MIEPLMYAVKAGYRFVVICSTYSELMDLFDSAKELASIGEFIFNITRNEIESKAGGWVRFSTVITESPFGGDRIKGISAEVVITDRARRDMYERPTANTEKLHIVAVERSHYYRAHLPKEEGK